MRHLYIIGNGFDLHHSIPSSYYDYMRWVELRYPMLYDEISRTFTDADKESWWADFEMRLADVECMYNFEVIVYPDYTIEGISMNGRNSAERLAALYKAIQRTFAIWVSGLNDYLMSSVQPDISFDTDAMYLTFNYTNTLQDIYHIPDSQVLHIHGNVRRGDDVIIGHDSDGGAFPYIQEEIIDITTDGYEVAEQISAFRKPTSKLIEAHRIFFESLGETLQISVCGFSFSFVDMPYIKEIIKYVSDDVEWKIYVHSLRDVMKMTELCEKMQLNTEFKEW